MDDYIALLRDALARGATLDGALAILRDRKASILDSIKCVREVKAVSLGEAKQLVAGSPVWDDIRDDHDRFVEKLIKLLDLDSS